MAKIMRKKNLKIQNLAGNTLKSCLHSGSQISTTLICSNTVPPDEKELHQNKAPSIGQTSHWGTISPNSKKQVHCDTSSNLFYALSLLSITKPFMMKF